MSCNCPVVHRRTFPKDFPSQSFVPGRMDDSLHHKFIQLPHLAVKQRTLDHAPPQSSQCPYGQRLDMQPSQTLEA